MSESEILHKSLSTNDTFTITLKSNPSYGYLWYLDGLYHDDLNSPSVLFKEMVVEPLYGYAGSKQNFHFSTTNKLGKSKLSFIYKRSWENTGMKTQDYIIQVEK